MLRDLTVESVNKLLTTVEALLIFWWAVSGENFLDSVFVQTACTHHSLDGINDAEIWHEALVNWAVLAIPFSLDLEPD